MPNKKPTPEYDGDTTQDVFNHIKEFNMKCPVMIFNVENFAENELLGMYMMTKKPDENEKTLKEITSPGDNLKENTILFFNDRHLMELMATLHGMFRPIVALKIMDDHKVYMRIIELIKKLKYPVFYSDLDNITTSWMAALRLTDGVPDAFMALFRPILKYIWFISYGGYDTLMEEARVKYTEEAANGGDTGST